MEEEAPMSLVEDHFDDMSIDDRPLDGESFYNEEELEEEEVQPTSENFSVASRYRPSQRTPGQLPTIREEKHDESRSNPGSTPVSRPASSNLRMNLSNNSHDMSNQFQFQNGVNAIEQYTENFYSKQNEAERLFPEHELLQPGNFASPPFDKQNSWEPSVCHYEKQPTPEVITDSPKTIFGNLSKVADKTDKADKVNDENVPQNSLRVSPERSIFTTSPLNSTKFLEAKTSTPKRPGASNRFGQRQPPILEYSTIYESPQRVSSDKPNTSRLFRPATTQNQTSTPASSSETMLSNRTINESLVRKVISGSTVDADLFTALENARKKREMAPSKPDFRPKAVPSRSKPKILPPVPVPPALPVPALPAPAPTSLAISEVPTSSRPRHQKSERQLDVSNSNTTNCTNLTRMSTTTGVMAKSMLSSREDLSRASSRARLSSTSSSTSTVNTVIPNHHHPRSDSVNTSRTVSRASSIVPQNPVSTRPLRIAAKRMAFGVIPINETLTMELEVENVSDRRCQVQAKIDSKTSVYEVLDSKMTLIEPGKSTKIRVAFTPTSLGRYQVLLTVEVPAQNYRAKIPIWGIGGTALITPITTANDLHGTANAAEFVMHVANLSRISFKLANVGSREGFALISVLDSSLRPLPSYSTKYFPANGLVLRRQHEKRIDIRLDTAVLDDPECRTSSAMSSVSTARRRASEADLVIRIAWAEEVLRQRLKMLETQSSRHQPVDSLDFTSFRFADEEPARPVDQGFPAVVPEDFSLFSSSYRTIYVFIYSSATAFRKASASRAAADCTESTILETTAFRNQTFVNDATVMPRGKK